MITKIKIARQGNEHYIAVETNNGGDQSYGPYFNKAPADVVTTARTIVENDFEEVFDDKPLEYSSSSI